MLAEAATLLRPGALDPQTPTCGLDRAPAAELTLWGLPGSPLSPTCAPLPVTPPFFSKGLSSWPHRPTLGLCFHHLLCL